MEVKNLEVLLMDNNEILFHGRSLGTISEEEKEAYITDLQFGAKS